MGRIGRFLLGSALVGVAFGLGVLSLARPLAESRARHDELVRVTGALLERLRAADAPATLVGQVESWRGGVDVEAPPSPSWLVAAAVLLGLGGGLAGVLSAASGVRRPERSSPPPERRPGSRPPSAVPSPQGRPEPRPGSRIQSTASAGRRRAELRARWRDASEGLARAQGALERVLSDLAENRGEAERFSVALREAERGLAREADRLEQRAAALSAEASDALRAAVELQRRTLGDSAAQDLDGAAATWVLELDRTARTASELASLCRAQGASIQPPRRGVEDEAAATLLEAIRGVRAALEHAAETRGPTEVSGLDGEEAGVAHIEASAGRARARLDAWIEDLEATVAAHRGPRTEPDPRRPG